LIFYAVTVKTENFSVGILQYGPLPWKRSVCIVFARSREVHIINPKTEKYKASPVKTLVKKEKILEKI